MVVAKKVSKVVEPDEVVEKKKEVKAPESVETVKVEEKLPEATKPVVAQAPRPAFIPTPQTSYAGGQATPTTSYAGGQARPFVPRPAPVPYVNKPYIPAAQPAGEEVSGFLELSSDGHGVLRAHFSPSEKDAYIPSMVIRRMGLRPGDQVEGMARVPKENERYYAMMTVTKVNGKVPTDLHKRIKFHNLTPIYPIQHIKLETGAQPLSTRLIDLTAPIGRGQRGMIVAPPKAGKTTILKDMMTGVAANYPDIHLMAVLTGERPEEVTDIRRHIEAVTKNSEMPGECASSNFDEPAEDQTKVAEIALERAKRLVEEGKDVMILLDSITRLARAYNLAIPTSGRTLSGGFDPAALYPPKRFFGAARKMEGGGSLTIIGTALIETGSRMDELIYEEFKGTGNMELTLDRRLAERRIYPAIDVRRSGTRRDDLLYSQSDYQNVIVMNRMLDMLNDEERTDVLVQRLAKTKSNREFLAALKEG